jgi:CubicO group peptidase (beta-lactamase class C family)
MHKGVLALLVGVALADGALPGIDVPIGNYIDAWASEARGKITLRQTLEMTSGLKVFSKAGGILSEHERFVNGLWPETIILNQPLQRAPGTEFRYFNLDSQLAGMVLQKAVGRRYAEFLSEKLWKPLGAKDAYVWPYKPNSMARTYSSMFARAEDWLRVGVMLKDRGQFEGRQIVPSAWIDRMIQPSVHNPNFGLNVWRADPYVKQRWYGNPEPHMGTITGEAWVDPGIFFLDGAGGQRVYVSRAEDLVIVRMGTTLDNWEDSALPNAIIRAVRATKPVS